MSGDDSNDVVFDEPKPRHCSNCGKPGHRRTTCESRVRDKAITPPTEPPINADELIEDLEWVFDQAEMAPGSQELLERQEAWASLARIRRDVYRALGIPMPPRKP